MEEDVLYVCKCGCYDLINSVERNKFEEERSLKWIGEWIRQNYNDSSFEVIWMEYLTITYNMPVADCAGAGIWGANLK